MTARELIADLKGVKKSGAGWVARCPAHDDKRASLSVSESDDGRLLLKCHAGCEFEAILAATHSNDNGRREVAAYDYRDEDGNLLYQSVRFEPKSFLQRRPNGPDWEWSLNGTRRLLYRLPEILAANPTKTILIVEGEKDADNLAQLGLIATTNSGGAGKWRRECGEPLRGRKVVILPDNDEPGQKHGRQIAGLLHGIAENVKIVDLPGLPEKGDVTDWIAAGGTVEQLRKLVETSPLFESQVALSTSEHHETLRFVRMAEVVAKPVEWLWKLFIAIGAVTIVEGPPGVGKSTLCCAVTAAITRGKGLPGMDSFEPGTVLLCSAEDSKAHTLRPRLDAAGADVTRVFALDEPLTLDSYGMLQLETAVIKYKPRFVYFDPFFAFTGSKKDIHRANEMREVTAWQTAIAEKYGCAILDVRHLAKSRGQGHALNAGVGSIDLVAAARSVLLVGQDPDDGRRRAMVQIKNNLGPVAPAIGFTLEDGNFYWTGESNLTADRILSLAGNQEERSAVDEAIDFLRESLAAGDRETAEVMGEARRVGITDKTLRNARERLKIRARREGLPGTKQRFYWSLPESAEQESAIEEIFIPAGASDKRIDEICRAHQEART